MNGCDRGAGIQDSVLLGSPRGLRRGEEVLGDSGAAGRRRGPGMAQAAATRRAEDSQGRPPRGEDGRGDGGAARTAGAEQPRGEGAVRELATAWKEEEYDKWGPLVIERRELSNFLALKRIKVFLQLRYPLLAPFPSKMVWR